MNIQHLKQLSATGNFLVSALEELKEKAPDVLQHYLAGTKRESIALPVANKIGWEVLASDPTVFNIAKLKLLYFLLVQYKYISSEKTSYVIFASNFINNENPYGERIIWTGKNYALPLLFSGLRRNRVIPDVGNLFDILRDHFVDKDGKELNKASLENQAARGGLMEEGNISDIILFLTYNK